MKVKKEYILLGLLIVSSIFYLVFKQTDRIHYTLPELKALKADDITRIEITRAGKTTVLFKKDKAWHISPNYWRADQTKVSEMLDKLSGLTVTDLVSESKSYDRYQLDDNNKAILKAFSGNEITRELSMGKTAPTNSHTYIRLPGDNKVYLASGDLPRLFKAPTVELRDMLVLGFASEQITSIEILRAGKSTVLTKEALPADKSQKEPAKGAVKLFIWKIEKGETVDKAIIDPFLSGLSRVYCEKYLDDGMKASLVNPAISLKLKGAKEYTLSIFEKTGEIIPAVSSGSESPFVFPGYKLDTLKKALDEIMGKQASNEKKHP
jgi:hypothetical protein